jgi:membrane protein implicated in regulation of membrane protease activity
MMADHWTWWILAAMLVGAELMSGTFYLVAIGIAFAIGGAVAWLGASTPVQLLVAGVLAVVGASAAHWWRRRHGEPPRQPGLDIGHAVHVRAWHADGTARVDYRGTQWDGVPESAQTPRNNTMYIVATRGSILVLGASPP